MEDALSRMRTLPAAQTLERLRTFQMDKSSREERYKEAEAQQAWSNPVDMAEKRSRLPRVAQPKQFSGEMYTYQREGLGGMLQLKTGGILADEMGLGKTIQMIAYLLATREVKSPGELTRTSLLILPANLVCTWQKAFNTFVVPGGLKVLYGHPSAEGGRRPRDVTFEEVRAADVFVVSREAVKSEYSRVYKEAIAKADPTNMDIPGPDDETADLLFYGQDRVFADVIVDEAHAICNYKGVFANAVNAIARDRSWGMTGTLVRNYLTDVYAYFVFLRVPHFSEEEKFKTKFISPKATHVKETYLLNLLHAAIYPWIIRRTKYVAFPDFPRLKREHIMLQLDAAAADNIRAMEEQKNRTSYTETLGAVRQDPRAWYQKARMAVLHSALVMPTPPPDTPNEERKKTNKQEWQRRKMKFEDPHDETHLVESSVTLNKTLELILTGIEREHRPDYRAIVFAPWVRALDLMEMRLLKHDRWAKNISRIYRIEGTQSFQQREKIIAEFRVSLEGSVLLASIACLQEGHNLSEASHVLFPAVTWTPTNELQALSRAWRIGQKHEVLVQILRTDTWIDHHVWNVRKRKMVYEAYILEGEGLVPVPASTDDAEVRPNIEQAWPLYDHHHPDPRRTSFIALRELVNTEQLRETGPMRVMVSNSKYNTVAKNWFSEQDQNAIAGDEEECERQEDSEDA